MALEGSLRDMALTDLIHVFQVGDKSGVLFLHAGDDHGRIYVYNGRLLDAVVAHGSVQHVLATGDTALLSMLSWDDAAFLFEHDPAVGQYRSQITQSSDWFINEGVRLRGERLRQQGAITLSTQLELSLRPGNGTHADLSLSQLRTMTQVSLYQTAGEICAHTNADPGTVIAAVTELVALGLVDLVQAQVPVLQPPHGAAGLAEGVLQPVRTVEALVEPTHENALIEQADPDRAGHVDSPTHELRNGHEAASEPLSSTPAPAPAPAPRRGILNAIMRRIRGL